MSVTKNSKIRFLRCRGTTLVSNHTAMHSRAAISVISHSGDRMTRGEARKGGLQRKILKKFV